VKFVDSKVVEGISNVTSPLAIAKSVSTSLAKNVLLASITDENGREVLSDINKPLISDCSLKLLTFESPEGKKAFWHSSAHILGSALEKFYGDIALDDGPALPEGSHAGGFFYDFKPGSKGSVSPKHFDELNAIAKKLIDVRILISILHFLSHLFKCLICRQKKSLKESKYLEKKRSNCLNTIR
jgi:threonyl-tRNA synthetase